MSSDLPPSDRCRVEPTEAQLALLDGLEAERPVVMLNLLRFRDVADYSGHPDLAPEEPISGAEAYQRYGEVARALLAEIGASVDYLGSGSPPVIGPEDERWDLVLLVRYPSRAAFVSMITSPGYLEAAGHRVAALADSRLVPTFG